jgi:hypothetical protein
MKKKSFMGMAPEFNVIKLFKAVVTLFRNKLERLYLVSLSILV